VWRGRRSFLVFCLFCIGAVRRTSQAMECGIGFMLGQRQPGFLAARNGLEPSTAISGPAVSGVIWGPIFPRVWSGCPVWFLTSLLARAVPILPRPGIRRPFRYAHVHLWPHPLIAPLSSASEPRTSRARPRHCVASAARRATRFAGPGPASVSHPSAPHPLPNPISRA